MGFLTRLRTALLPVAVMGANACSSPPAAAPGSGSALPDASADVRAALGDTIHVRLGRTATVDDGRLMLTFRSHGADSRCPATVVCVWMGDVALRIAARAGGTRAEVDLHTGLEPRTLAIGRYVVKVIGMLPYPGTTPSDTTPTALLLVTAQ